MRRIKKQNWDLRKARNKKKYWMNKKKKTLIRLWPPIFTEGNRDFKISPRLGSIWPRSIWISSSLCSSRVFDYLCNPDHVRVEKSEFYWSRLFKGKLVFRFKNRKKNKYGMLVNIFSSFYLHYKIIDGKK